MICVVCAGHQAGNNNLLLQFDGFMNASVYVGAFQHVAKTYFTRSNYYRVPTTLANGTVAQCCYYAMYQMNYFVEGVCAVNYFGCSIF